MHRGSHTKPVYIYFMRAGRYVKIGVTNDVQRRLKHTQIHHPEPLQVACVLRGTYDDEHALHEKFWPVHVRGEWFEFDGPIAAFLAQLERPLPERWLDELLDDLQRVIA